MLIRSLQSGVVANDALISAQFQVGLERLAAEAPKVRACRIDFGACTSESGERFIAMGHAQDSLADDVDLTNCDREAIHIPGSIQDHGFLLALALTEDGQFRVVVASENASRYLHRPTADILHAELEQLLPMDIDGQLRKGLLSEGASGDFARFIGTIRLPSKDAGEDEFQIVAHRSGNLYLLEFEQTESTISQNDLNTVITNFVSTLEESRTSFELCHAITVQIRKLRGFDRVMLWLLCRLDLREF